MLLQHLRSIYTSQYLLDTIILAFGYYIKFLQLYLLVDGCFCFFLGFDYFTFMGIISSCKKVILSSIAGASDET